MDRWLLIRDILLTGTGIAVILSQVFSPNPRDILLATGLALTAPSIAAHTKELLTGRPAHTGGGSSPASPQPGPVPSPSPSPGGTDGAA